MIEPAQGSKAAEPTERAAARDEAAGQERPLGAPGMPAAARQAPRLSICNWNGR